MDKLSNGFYCQRETEEFPYSDTNMARNLYYTLDRIIKLIKQIYFKGATIGHAGVLIFLFICIYYEQQSFVCKHIAT